MARAISIRERIMRVARLAAAGIDGIGTVYRWDLRGLRDPETGKLVNASGERNSLKHGDGQIFNQGETAEDGGEGNEGATTVKTLTLQLDVKLAMADDADTRSTDEIADEWLTRMEAAMLANVRWQEPADPPVGNQELLAIDTRVTALSGPPGDTPREFFAVILLEVTYEHYRVDPAAGPGVTRFEEEVL